MASLQKLQSLKVQFISYRDDVDPTTASGRMFTKMLGVLAEYQRELIRERTVAGLEEARRRGVKLVPAAGHA